MKDNFEIFLSKLVFWEENEFFQKFLNYLRPEICAEIRNLWKLLWILFLEISKKKSGVQNFLNILRKICSKFSKKIWNLQNFLKKIY